ncbi:hypothetical protein GQ53DRAFT_443537 [Thozetella sp. PMI_491]|nr:hypothetical protein GQ53DRAFT_443537 [Thozetella sp. PMI_491]
MPWLYLLRAQALVLALGSQLPATLSRTPARARSFCLPSSLLPPSGLSIPLPPHPGLHGDASGLPIRALCESAPFSPQTVSRSVLSRCWPTDPRLAAHLLLLA